MPTWNANVKCRVSTWTAYVECLRGMPTWNAYVNAYVQCKRCLMKLYYRTFGRNQFRTLIELCYVSCDLTKLNLCNNRRCQNQRARLPVRAVSVQKSLRRKHEAAQNQTPHRREVCPDCLSPAILPSLLLPCDDRRPKTSLQTLQA